MWISCDNCDFRYICRIKYSFEDSLKESKHILDHGKYPELCQEIFEIVAKKYNKGQTSKRKK